MIRGNSCLNGKVKCKYESIRIYVISKCGGEYLESIIFLFIIKSDHFFRVPKNNLRKQIAKICLINYMPLS